VSRTSGLSGPRWWWSAGGATGYDPRSPAGRYRAFVSGFASSRAQLMKSCAIGLSVRFFKVMIPTGNGIPGVSTGSALSGRRLSKRNIDIGIIVMNRPVASRW
jgi:hypothetical protein